MADDQDFEMWDEEFLEAAIKHTQAALRSSSSNLTQPPPPPPQQLFRPHPQSVYTPPISYSPPRKLSQRVKEDDHMRVLDKGFDCPVSLNGINQGFTPRSFRLHEEDLCLKQQEITRLKEALGRVSKLLANLEQECLELRKDREKNEKHLPVNEPEDAESFC